MLRNTKELNNKRIINQNSFPNQIKNNFTPIKLVLPKETTPKQKKSPKILIHEDSGNKIFENNCFFRKFKSQEIKEKNENNNQQNLTEFDKQFILKKNKNSDFFDDLSESEEIKKYNLKNRKIFKIDIIEIRKEFENGNKVNLLDYEIYIKQEKEKNIINNESESLKIKSKNNEKTFYKIITPKKEKNKEEEKGEINILNQRKINKDLKKIINPIEDKNDTTNEDTRTNGNKSESIFNSFEIKSTSFDERRDKNI